MKLTAKAQKIYDQTLPLMRNRQRSLFAHLDETEIKAIYSALEKLEKAAHLSEDEL